MSSITIPFNKPTWFGVEESLISEAFANNWVSGDGPFTKKAETELSRYLAGCKRVLLTTSCTHALEMSAILLDLEPGDEVIVPSFTFVTTALAFYMHGATPVFADIRADTKNIDENLVEDLITERTRAIVPVHYAGVGCEMDVLQTIASKHDLKIIEDNAHGLFGRYMGRPLGTIGHLATQSFHETKNITCGEGGALVINDQEFLERAEIIREKGTNRSKFFRGEVDKYSWCDKGSSYVMSDILAAFLYGQLQHAEDLQQSRKNIWDRYNNELGAWAADIGAQLPCIPDHCEQAYHMFYLVMPDMVQRTRFIQALKSVGIHSVFHYLPLNESDFIKGVHADAHPCPVSKDVSERLVRLPFYSSMSESEQSYIIEKILRFSPG